MECGRGERERESEMGTALRGSGWQHPAIHRCAERACGGRGSVDRCQMQHRTGEKGEWQGAHQMEAGACYAFRSDPTLS